MQEIILLIVVLSWTGFFVFKFSKILKKEDCAWRKNFVVPDEEEKLK